MLKIKNKIISPSSLSEVKKLSGEVLDKLSGLGVDQQTLLNIKLAVEEALINAVRHGNNSKPCLKIYFSYCIDQRKITITVKDQGKGYDYQKIPDATDKERLSTLSGRGVFLIRHVMDEVKYNKSGNRITMVKYLTNDGKKG